jgi:opacity protein-like surface antigen
MRRAWMTLLAVAALAVPVSAAAVVSPNDSKNAAQFCKALRTDMGTTAFKQAYGTNKNRSNAFGKCVSKSVSTLDQNQSQAVRDCKTERDADPAAFAVKYGTNKNGKNAFGKCVSQNKDQATSQDHNAIVSASKQCRSERAQDPAAFREKYGTNHNKRNAFGKCVSKHAKEIQQGNQPPNGS